MINKMVVFARPRVGSYYLLDLLRNFQNTFVEMELYNHSVTPNSNFTQYLQQWLRSKYGDIELPPNFGHRYYEDLAKSLRQFQRDYIKQETLIYKVIIGHVPHAHLLEIAADEQLLSLRLDRPVLDSFVSYLKAKTLDQYHSVDTTEMLVSISDEQLLGKCAEYAAIIEEERNFDCFLRDRNRPVVRLDYEELKALASHEEAVGLIQNKFQQQSIELTVRPKIEQLFFQQDKGTNTELKQRILSLYPAFA